jgi:hypothetical protein
MDRHVDELGCLADGPERRLHGYLGRSHERNDGPVGVRTGIDVEEYWDVQTRQGRKDSTFVRDVAVRFENTGTAHLRVKSSVEIRDETTRVVQRIEGPEAYITPRAFRDIIVRVPALPRGRYVAVVLLDHGADEITATQLELEVP